MCRRTVLLAVACLLVDLHNLQASVIIKTVPHANVKMEFGAHHVPPHDVALLDESAKVDGTTRLGIEVPHSQNHRNVLIHKIGTYLTVVMKALAKTVAPSQNQDGKTHFDIHVDADLGENDSKDKKEDPPQFTIVQSKHGEVAEQIKGDCVKAVVIVSESEDDDKKEQHKSSEKHPKDEHKKKDSHIVFHYSSEDSKESKDHHKQNIHQVLEEQIKKSEGDDKKEKHKQPEKHSKDEHKKKDSHIVFHYSSEDSKEYKDYHKQNIHEKEKTLESESDEKKKEHKSSGKHPKGEHKKNSHIMFHLSNEDSKESKDYHEQNIHEVLEEKMQESEGDEKKKEYKSSGKHPKYELKKDSHIVFDYSNEDSKEHHKQNIEVLEEKIQGSKEEKKEYVSEPFKFEAPKDWESFKKTQELLKEKGFVLQLDKSYFISEENQQKPSQKVTTLDAKSKVKLFLEGKSLSEEEMEESERTWKSLELTEADPEEMWISMANPTDTNSRYQAHSEKNEAYSESPSYSKTQAIHTSSVNDVSTGGKQIQTVKTTYQSGPVIVTTTKLVTEGPSNGNKAVSYEMVKQTSIPEKLSIAKAELSSTANEIPSHVSSHFQQTSYSSDRSRSMTIVSKDPTMDPGKGAMSQPVAFDDKDKPNDMWETSKTVPHLKAHDDSSREVIMRLAPGSKTGPTKKAQIIDAKKVKITKPDTSSEVKPDGAVTRQEGIRKLPMANIPTLIDVLQKSPPQEVQRLTQLASDGSSQVSQRESSSAEDRNSPVASTNIRDPVPSTSPRELQLSKLHVDDLNSEERKGLARSIEDLKSSAPNDYKESFKTARNEKLHTHSEETHTSNEGSIPEVQSSEHPDGASKGLEVTKKSNLEDNTSAEELGSSKSISKNPSNPKSMGVIINTEPEKHQKELVMDSLKSDDDQTVAKDRIDHEGDRDQKTFRNDVKNFEEEEISSGGSATTAIEDIGNDPGASHAFSLSSLTASAEEARALDISSLHVEKQLTELPVVNVSPVEDVAVSPRNLKQDDKFPQQGFDVSDTSEQISEVARLGRVTSPGHSEETEHKEEIIADKPSFIENTAVEHFEPKKVAPSDYDGSYVYSPVTESSTTPSLPEKESMNVPMHKERELNLDADPNKLVSNLVEINEEVPVDVGRDGRIFDSQLDSSSALSPLSAIIPETSVSTQGFPLNNAIHDPNSPFIYSYYPALHPKGAHTLQNKTVDAQGLYGRPSPRVICVNTDTGKVLGDSSTIDDHSNAVTRYPPEVLKSNKEDDNLMLLKLLHEDIQKLKQQLKIQ